LSQVSQPSSLWTPSHQPLRRGRVIPLRAKPWFHRHRLSLPDGHHICFSVAAPHLDPAPDQVGIPLVIEPGFSATPPVYYPMASHLVRADGGGVIEQGHRVFILEAPSHGDTSPLRQGRRDVRSYIDFSLRVITQFLGLRRFILIGHSFGSLRVAGVAAAEPERTLGLQLVDGIASPKWERWMELLAREPWRVPRYIGQFIEDGVDTIPFGERRELLKLFFSAGIPYLRNAPKMARLAHPGLAILMHRGSGDLLDRIRQAQVPTAVLHGDRDLIVHPSVGDEVTALTSATPKRIVDGGHAWPIKRPWTLADITRELYGEDFGRLVRDIDPADCYEPNARALRLELDENRPREPWRGETHYKWETRSFV